MISLASPQMIDAWVIYIFLSIINNPLVNILVFLPAGFLGITFLKKFCFDNFRLRILKENASGQPTSLSLF